MNQMKIEHDGLLNSESTSHHHYHSLPQPPILPPPVLPHSKPYPASYMMPNFPQESIDLAMFPQNTIQDPVTMYQSSPYSTMAQNRMPEYTQVTSTSSYILPSHHHSIPPPVSSPWENTHHQQVTSHPHAHQYQDPFYPKTAPVQYRESPWPMSSDRPSPPTTNTTTNTAPTTANTTPCSMPKTSTVPVNIDPPMPTTLTPEELAHLPKQIQFLALNPHYLTGVASPPSQKTSRSVAQQLFVKDMVSQRFPCKLCGHSFMRINGLKRHIMMHLNIKPYRCSICQRKFSRIDVYKRHVSLTKCAPH